MAATRGPTVVPVIFILMAAGFAGLPAHAKYSGGSGTAKNPYRIATKADLLALAANTKDYALHFVLTADISLSGQKFTLAVIASSPDVGEHYEFEGTPFTGTFDGDGHKITGLEIDGRGTKGYLGLFGCIEGGLVKDLRLERVSIGGSGLLTQYVGLLVGFSAGGTIINCSVAGDITGIGGPQVVGALAGMNGAGGLINRCRAVAGTTNGRSDVGGLVGRNAPGARITDCRADGGVDGELSCVGGLVGFNEGTISRSQATGAITDSEYGMATGGLVGLNEGIIIHCRSTGDITAGDHSLCLGALAGTNDPHGTIIDSHATGSVTGEAGTGAGGLVGGNSGVIANCYATGSTTGEGTTWGSGGIAGHNVGVIACCYATGNVTGRNAVYMGGGLVGHNDTDGMIIDCYATGNTAGFFAVGGLVGGNESAITHCYAIGKATASGTNSRTGGLCGRSYSPGQVVNSYWDTQTSGQSTSAGGTGKTTVQMQTARTFLDGAWDFKYIWDIVERQTYPFLRFNPPADLNGDGKVDLRDYARFAANWSKTCGVSTNPKAPLPACPLVGDLNYDKKADASDLSLMAVQWLDSRGRAASQ